MPTIICSVCNRSHRIPTGKWKLVLDSEPFVCSAACVLKWLENTRDTLLYGVGDTIKAGGVHKKQSFRTDFRSDFERRFAEWLVKNGFVFGYEEWLFPVGTTVYIPDFHVNPCAAFVETKGLWRLGQKKKFKKFRAQYPEVPILVVPWLLQNEFK